MNEGKRRRKLAVREGTFLIGGGGAGLRRGGSLVNSFTNWGGSNLLYSQPGEGQFSFGEQKITPCCLVDSYLLTNTRSV